MERFNAFTAWLLALGGDNLSRLSSSGLVSSAALPDAVEAAAAEAGRIVPLFMAVGLNPSDSLSVATAKMNAAALRLVVESFSSASLFILIRAGVLITGSESTGAEIAAKIWKDTLPLGIARESFDVVWEFLTKSTAQNSGSLVAAGVAMGRLVDALLSANPSNKDALTAKAVLEEKLLPSVPEASVLWRRGVFVSPAYAPTAGPKGDGYDTPSLDWAAAGFNTPAAGAADKSAGSGIRLGEYVTATNAVCALILVWLGFRNSVDNNPESASLYRQLKSTPPTVSHRGLTFGATLDLINSVGAIWLPELAATVQRRIEQAFLLIASSETETSSVPGATAMYRLVEKAGREPAAANFSSLIELKKAMMTIKETGGLEEGFLPLLAMAAPLLGSFLSGMGGSGGGGGGGGGGGFKLPGLELLSGLLGGGGQHAGPGGAVSASPMSGIASLLNPMGIISTVASLFGRGRRKRKGGLETGHALLPIMDSMFHANEKMVEAGGKKKKRKKRRSHAPAVSDDDRQTIATLRRQVRLLRSKLRSHASLDAEDAETIDDIDDDAASPAVPNDEGLELNELVDSTRS